MKYRTRALVFLALSVILLATALVMGVRALAPASAESGESGGAGFSLSGLFSRATPTPEPTAVPTETPEPTATPWPGPDIPEQAVPVGKEYFEDAAFLGNSVLSGLWYYDYGDVTTRASGSWTTA